MRNRKEDTTGPEYPKLNGLSTWRKRVFAELSSGERREYGAKVLEKVRALQRSELFGALEPISPRCQCASGSPSNDGAEILRTVRAQHEAALAAYPAQERRKRTPKQWAAMYEAAMHANHNARPVVS